MPSQTETFDVVIVGAGFAGLYMLHRMHETGRSARVIEAGGDVGGTWYWNRYPGARCDVESMEYSYSFDEDLQQEWEWKERYSAQSEIEEYAQHVADRFDLRKDIQFDTRVTSAHYDEAAQRWTVTTDQNDTFSARYVIMATGCLSAANMPLIDGIDSYQGESYHTGEWPKEPVSFEGKRVAIIGTGSSGIQATPVIAETAKTLTVFQRTASYSLPSANAPLEPAEVAEIKARYPEIRAANEKMPAAIGAQWTMGREDSVLEVDEAERNEVFESSWTEGGFTFMRSFPDLTLSDEANSLAADFVKKKIHDVVADQHDADLLSPAIPIGCKRMVIDTAYYQAFNLPHVSLVDASEEPIEAITPAGIRTSAREHEFDLIVYATGFDAMTGALLRVDIQGRDGLRLQDAWEAGPRTYLGLNMVGFPNLFTITGPGSPSVLANMITCIQQHVNWITDGMDYLSEQGLTTMEATQEAQDAWVIHVNDVAADTVFNDSSCNSWYLGANIEGKSRVFMPLIGYPPYVEKCDEVAANGYEGFVLS